MSGSTGNFHDFPYHATKSVGVGVRCGVLELQLPTAGFHPWVEDVDLADLHMTATLYCNHLPLHEVPISTHTPPHLRSAAPPAVVWHAELPFPAKYRDVSPNAQLVFTIWRAAQPDAADAPENSYSDFRSPSGGGGVPLGGCSMHLFSETGVVKTGLQKLRFYPGEAGRPHLPGMASMAGEAYDTLLPSDHGFLAAKAQERYQAGEVPTRGHRYWLDAKVHARLEAVKQAMAQPDNDMSGASLPPYCSASEVEIRSSAFLLVELPMFAAPVLFEERPYPFKEGDTYAAMGILGSFNPGDVRATAEPEGGGPAPIALGAPALQDDTAEQLKHKLSKAAKLLGSEDGIDARHMSLRSSRRGLSSFRLGTRGVPLRGAAFCAVLDYDDNVNLVEDKYHKLHHDQFRGGQVDPTLKPNRDEKSSIERIIASPNVTLRREEKDLLWKFRYQLTDDQRALTKFLLAVEWDVGDEVEQVQMLLQEWQKRAPIDVADALKLLGKERAFQHQVVRAFAVQRLHLADDEELLLYLLQLVQALKYEPSQAGVLLAEPPDADPSAVQAQVAAQAQAQARGSALAEFLVRRGCASLTLANFLYWYVKVEEKDPRYGSMYANVMRLFKEELQATERGQQISIVLRMLDVYVGKVTKCLKAARAVRGRQKEKEEEFRRLLAQENLANIAGSGTAAGIRSLPVPIRPELEASGINPHTAFMFKSAIYPAAVEMTLSARRTARERAEGKDVDDGDMKVRPSAQTRKLRQLMGEEMPDNPEEEARAIRVIFKSGDDLRQDQLTLQMIALMDKLLKRVNLDLKLRPYVTLATGPEDGIMEFVTESTPVSGVLAKYNNSILAYLQHFNPDPRGPYGVTPECLSTFVKSCAGYCVITYILGVGDRHLDNIMMQTAGNLFHLDFGFIFGRDPKPLPPPFRFTREMADAMGGEASEHYARFKTYLCQAYNWLRKSANLILNMLSLMADAGIEDLRNDPDATLAKVQERFRLDLNDEQAEHFMLQLLNESLTSFAPQVMEIFHKISVARR